MKRILAPIALCGLFVVPAYAVSANVQSAIDTINAVAADSGKVKTYCEMDELIGEDEEEAAAGAKKAAEPEAPDPKADAEEAADEKKADELMKQLGPDFEKAMDAGEELDPASADGKAFDAALDALGAKCPE